MRPSWPKVLFLLALPALLPACAPWLAHWHWSLDLAANFPLQALVALAAGGALLAWARRPLAACVLLLGAVLAGCHVASPWQRVAPAAVEGRGLEVRLAAINLLRENGDAGAVLQALAGTEVDLVFCSEVTPAWQQALRSLRARLPHVCECPDPGYYGVLLLSRWPLLEAEVIPLGVAWAPAIRATIKTPAGPLGVLGLHTPRPGTGSQSQQRDAALAALPAAAATLCDDRVVLGDFNATPWTPALGDAMDRAGLHFCGWPPPTWPALLPLPLRIPIDHVLVTARLQPATIATGPFVGSDHLPLFATVRLPAPEVTAR